jgi:hypothetical protein
MANGTKREHGKTWGMATALLMALSLLAMASMVSAAYSQTFSYSGSIADWTVPATGIYTIEAYGARGGSNIDYTGGSGAKMSGAFYLTEGTSIKILAGGVGQTYPPSDGCNTGGGGGTFVWKHSGSDLLIAAGGGGGAGNSANGINAVTSTGGTAGSGTQNNPGSGGSGGNPGGAGWSSNGAGTNGAGGGYSPLNGGAGGAAGTADTGYGGFGGGSGGTGGDCSMYGAGGGGGYSGGAGQTDDSQSGGGGGSYNAGSSQDNTAGANSGNGYVTITDFCESGSDPSVDFYCYSRSMAYGSGASFSVQALFRLCSLVMDSLTVESGGEVTYDGTDVSVGAITVESGGTLRIING